MRTLIVALVLVAGCGAADFFVVTEAVQEVADKGKPVMDAVGVATGHPYALAASGILALVSGVLAFVNSKLKKAVGTMVVAVDDVEGIGATINALAADEGTTAIIKKVYDKVFG